MKQKLSILIFFIFLLTIGCSKESNNTNNNGNQISRSKQYVDYSSNTFNLTFDSDDRLTLMEGLNWKFTYQYGSGSVIQERVSGANVDYRYNSFLNSSQLIDTSTLLYANGTTRFQKYIYNSNNLLERYKSYDSAGIIGIQETYSYDAKGNMVELNYLNATDSIMATEHYTHTTLDAQFPLAVPYIAHRHKKFPASMTLTTNGVISYSETYTYTFDTNNRLTSQTKVSNTGLTQKQEYIY